MAEKAKRNDPCPCGSGKKYKSCCWSQQNTPKKIKNAKVLTSAKNLFHHVVGKDTLKLGGTE